MTTYAFKLPDIGEGIAEAEIVDWRIAIGDWVDEDDPIADVMTDKATIEMTAPVSGRVIKTAGVVGDRIAIGSILAVFETVVEAADAPAQTDHEEPLAAKVLPIQEPGAESDAARERDRVEAEVVLTATALHRASTSSERISASPAVRGRAHGLGIDLRDVKPDADGRIRHADLDAFLRYNGAYHATGRARADEDVPVIGLRRRIAENMAASKRHIPHFSYVEEIDVTKLEALRADLNDTRGHKSRLTILPLLVIALCRTLPDFPMMNALYDDESGVVTRKGAVHLGIATQTERGLVVPTIKHAETLNIWQLAVEVARLADAARENRIRPEKMSGSTLTITSLGPLGGLCTTPVINRPQVAIVGPNKVIERPIVKDGRVEIAKMMNLSISCDHRVVDGWDAAQFVQAVKRLLETPALLFTD